MDWITSLPLGNLGAGTLLALAVILIFRGDIVPRKVHDEVRQDRQKLQETNAILVETNRLLAQNTSLSVHALQAIEREAIQNTRGPSKEDGSP